jgi:hypothetical protein
MLGIVHPPRQTQYCVGETPTDPVPTNLTSAQSVCLGVFNGFFSGWVCCCASKPKNNNLTKKKLWGNVKDCAISLKAGKDVSKAPISC